MRWLKTGLQNLWAEIFGVYLYFLWGVALWGSNWQFKELTSLAGPHPAFVPSGLISVKSFTHLLSLFSSGGILESTDTSRWKKYAAKYEIYLFGFSLFSRAWSRNSSWPWLPPHRSFVFCLTFTFFQWSGLMRIIYFVIPGSWSLAMPFHHHSYLCSMRKFHTCLIFHHVQSAFIAPVIFCFSW